MIDHGSGSCHLAPHPWHKEHPGFSGLARTTWREAFGGVTSVTVPKSPRPCGSACQVYAVLKSWFEPDTKSDSLKLGVFAFASKNTFLFGIFLD